VRPVVPAFAKASAGTARKWKSPRRRFFGR